MHNEIIIKIKRNKRISDEIEIKSNLYSIFVMSLLSKEIFPKNNDIKKFLDIFDFGTELREYLYASRTLLISRVIRVIEKCDLNQASNYNDVLFAFFKIEETKKESTKTQIKEVSNIVTTLNRFSRKKNKNE